MARPLNTPNPENASIDELKAVSRVGSIETATRCTAIQLLLAGANRDIVIKALVVTDRALRKWINLFNQSGVDGLIVKKRPGRTSIIKKDQFDKLVDLIANPEKADRTFWTAKAYHGYISDTYSIECSYKTVTRFFHNQGFALKVPRPWSDRQDEELRKQFIERLENLYKDEGIDIWFADESGFEGDPRPRRRWDRKGKKTRVTKNGNHIRMNAIGMVCPRTGQFFAIETSHSDTETFQAFLNEANKFVKVERTKNVLIVDNATWHKKKTLQWHLWEPMFLPPYSPDLNPIERIWLTMKARWFNNYICKDVQQLLDRLDHAILDVIDRPERVQKTAAIGTLF